VYELIGATLEEFVEHLNLTAAGSTDETEVLATLDAATGIAQADAECGVGPIIQRPLTRRVRASTGYVMLPWTPAVELVAFTGVRGASDYDVSGLDLDTDTGIVRSAYGRLADGAYDVTYVAGHAATVDDVPSQIRLGVCLIGKHLWETQRGRGTARHGALGAGDVPDEKVPLGFLIPHRARAALKGSVGWVPLG
jgi:hypothetical protein